MNPTIEALLREYATALDEAAAVRARRVPTSHSASIAALDLPDRRARPPVKRRLVALVTVLSVIVAAAAIVIRHDSGSTPSPRTPETVPASGDGLRALFTRTTPQGVVIAARAGLVPIAATSGCPFVPVPSTQPASAGCTNATAPGVEFQYSVDGHTYRLTALNDDTSYPPGPRLVPVMALAQIREVRADGVTVPWTGTLTPYLAVLHASHVAAVRVNPKRTAATRLDEMKPVNGWVAFAARDSSAGIPFDMRIEGLDAAGHVVTTALPWRCC